MGANWRRAGLPLKLGAEGDDSWIVGLWLCLYLPSDTGTRLGHCLGTLGLCVRTLGKGGAAGWQKLKQLLLLREVRLG